MRHRSLCLVDVIALTLALFLSLASSAQADEVRFKDRTVFGTVTNISSDGVALDTGYGVVTVPLAEIESIKTDKLVYVIHGDASETSGTAGNPSAADGSGNNTLTSKVTPATGYRKKSTLKDDF